MRLATTAVATVALLSATHAFIPSTTSAPIRSTQIYAKGITGTVKWYNELRGFGFIEVDDGGPDMYVHATGLSFDGPLVDGERVSFITEIDRRTNKPKAVNVYREAPVELVDPKPVEKPDVEAAVLSEEPVAVADPVEEVVPAIAADEVVEEANINVEEFQAQEAFQRSLLQAKLAEDQKRRKMMKSIKAEKTQRALLETQLTMNSNSSRREKQVINEAAIAAARKKAIDAEKFQRSLLEEKFKNDKIINQQQKAAAEEAARIAAEKAAEEARLAEETRLAKEAEEKRIAEEKAAAEAARLAREKEDAMAKELGYSSFENMMTRQQPKSKEEEAALAQKYGAIENVGERAYAILKDLGAVEETIEPQV